MNKTFKLSTFVAKIMFFAFIMASFALSSVKAANYTENERMVMGTLRLSLWYQGINDGKKENQISQNTGNKRSTVSGVEELDRAMDIYSSSQESSSFDAMN